LIDNALSLCTHIPLARPRPSCALPPRLVAVPTTRSSFIDCPPCR
jgi:hypothetical protein